MRSPWLEWRHVLTVRSVYRCVRRHQFRSQDPQLTVRPIGAECARYNVTFAASALVSDVKLALAGN